MAHDPIFDTGVDKFERTTNVFNASQVHVYLGIKEMGPSNGIRDDKVGSGFEAAVVKEGLDIYNYRVIFPLDTLRGITYTSAVPVRLLSNFGSRRSFTGVSRGVPTHSGALVLQVRDEHPILGPLRRQLGTDMNIELRRLFHSNNNQGEGYLNYNGPTTGTDWAKALKKNSLSQTVNVANGGSTADLTTGQDRWYTQAGAIVNKIVESRLILSLETVALLPLCDIFVIAVSDFGQVMTYGFIDVVFLNEAASFSLESPSQDLAMSWVAAEMIAPRSGNVLLGDFDETGMTTV